MSAGIVFTFPQDTSDYEIIIGVSGGGTINWGDGVATFINPAQTQYSHTYSSERAQGEISISINNADLYKIIKAPTLSTVAFGNTSGIGTYAISTGSILTNNIYLVEGIESLSYGAFLGQSLVTTLTFPSTITSIGQNAVEGMTALTSVNFLSTVPPSFGAFPGQDSTPFKDCPNLATIRVPDGSVDAYKAAIPSRASIITGLGYTEIPSVEINNHIYRVYDELGRQTLYHVQKLLNDLNYAFGKVHIELTQAQYNSLSEAQKNNGTEYFITDAVAEGDFSNLESRLLKMESNFIDVSPNVTIVDPARYKSMTKVDANTVEIIVNDPVTTKDYKITVTASGSGNTRTNPQYTIEEVI